MKDIKTIRMEATEVGIEPDRCPLCGEVENLGYDKIDDVWSACQCKECSNVIWTTSDLDVFGIDACIEGVDISKYDCSTHTQGEYLIEHIKWRRKMFSRGNGNTSF